MSTVKLQEVQSGVYVLLNAKNGPEQLEHNGIILYRFMDFLYIAKPYLDELTPDEVTNLCRARASYPELINGGRANQEVRDLFEKLIHKLKPATVLEIGAGTNPLLQNPSTIHYVLADADEHVAIANGAAGRECHVFSQNSGPLQTNDDYFQLMMAVFVLQFPFYRSQLAELARCIAKTGVFVANVYRRTEIARGQLEIQMREAGFYVLRLPDSQNLCREHEYWIIGKDLKSIHACAALIDELLA